MDRDRHDSSCDALLFLLCAAPPPPKKSVSQLEVNSTPSARRLVQRKRLEGPRLGVRRIKLCATSGEKKTTPLEVVQKENALLKEQLGEGDETSDDATAVVPSETEKEPQVEIPEDYWTPVVKGQSNGASRAAVNPAWMM